jgi:hypothetical protein
MWLVAQSARLSVANHLPMTDPPEPAIGGADARLLADNEGTRQERPPRVLRVRRSHVALFLAVALVALVAWTRGWPGFVAWELAWDHGRDFGRRELPARVWSTDPADVAAWLESRGTPVPSLPSGTDDLELVGARYCPLFDRIAAHVFYSNGRHHASVFVLSGPLRIGSAWAGRARGRYLRLLHSAGRIVAVVGDRPRDVEALALAFRTSIVRSLDEPVCAPVGGSRCVALG